MSYFPCDIPFMSKDELEANGIKIHKGSEEIKDTNMIIKQQAIDSVLTLDVGNRVSWMDAVIDALDALPSFPQITSDTISRQDTIEAMEGVDWYHIDSNGRLVHGANSKKDEPLYKVEDVYKVLEQMPSAQSEEDCKNCKHGGLKDSRCDNCRVGCMNYPSYYERKTYG